LGCFLDVEGGSCVYCALEVQEDPACPLKQG
jgi:hypothetical protein